MVGKARMSVAMVTVKALLALQSRTYECRFHAKRPEREDLDCVICAKRGGWAKCERSKKLMQKVKESASDRTE